MEEELAQLDAEAAHDTRGEIADEETIASKKKGDDPGILIGL